MYYATLQQIFQKLNYNTANPEIQYGRHSQYNQG